VKVLLLDLTHGGVVLAESYAESGNEVTAVDIYHNCPAKARSNLEQMKVKVVDHTPQERFDLAVSPIHCPDHFLQGAMFERRLTHHQAVGELAHFNYPIIEVTGAVAKTSSCHILAHILRSKGKKVLLLTSRGLCTIGKEVEVLEEKASITPATILRISKLKGDWDYGIFECSLGGTGLADIGIVTNMREEYPIAAGTRSSVAGKMQMVRSSKHKIVIASEDLEVLKDNIPAEAEVTTFGNLGQVEVTVQRHLELGDKAPSVLRVHETNIPMMLSGNYLTPSYSTGLCAAAALAIAAGLRPEDIAQALSSFPGVPGRGEVKREDGKIIVINRNPGVAARSIDWNIRILEDSYGVDNMALIVDPIDAKVCEKLDLNEIADVAKRHPTVRAAYIYDREDGKVRPGPFIKISKPEEALVDNRVILWCTKEGYT
jgi:coenzyme F430 synthetase